MTPVTGTPPGYFAVRHILTSPSLGGRTAAHIGDRDFDWPGLLRAAETMSGGQQLLVAVAYDLWEAKGIVGLRELPNRLDRASFERVLDALRLCRGDVASDEDGWAWEAVGGQQAA
jgi:hypothetical protein